MIFKYKAEQAIKELFNWMQSKTTTQNSNNSSHILAENEKEKKWDAKQRKKPIPFRQHLRATGFSERMKKKI